MTTRDWSRDGGRGRDSEPLHELPDVWEGPVPEERSLESGLADVYDGPEIEDGPAPQAPPQEAGTAMAEIFEAVRRSETSDDDESEEESSHAAGSSGSPRSVHESPIVRIEPDRKASQELSRPDVTLIHHVVVPGAIIAMVGSLLFFLLDLRAAFVDGSFSLKWIGLCFVVATVLIARYSRLMGQPDNASLYSGALGGATFVAMAMSPWEPAQTKAWGPLLNGLALFVTWRFASRLTSNLSADLDHRARRRRRLYGLERQAFESVRKQQQAAGRAGFRLPLGGGKKSDSESAVRSIARLTLFGLAIFALGEPILRLAQPELAGKALASMVAFVIAAGTLLGAASVAAQQRRLERLHASAPWTLVTGRVLSALALTVVVLTLALQMPGVHVEGSGELRPKPADGRMGDGEASRNDPSESEDPPDSDGETEPAERGEESSASRRSETRETTSRGTSPPNPSFSFVSSLAQLGAFLRWPILVLVVIVVTVVVVRWIARQDSLGTALAKLLGGVMRRLGGQLADAWQRLGKSLSLLRFWRRGRKGKTRRRGDPFASMAELRGREPGPAIIGAYAVLQAALSDLGHARSAEVTPLEYYRAIPGILQRLRPSAERLTRLYLLAAYAPAQLGDAQRKQALDALEELRLAARLHADELVNR